MVDIALAIAPIFILILVGWGLHHRKIFDDGFWAPAEKLTYYVLFPALIVGTLGGQDLSGAPVLELLAAVVVTLTTAAAVLYLWWRVTKRDDGPAFTSILQGGIRFNTYVALSVAEGLYGAEGLAVAALVAGLFSAYVNLLCVSAFTLWGASGGGGAKALVRQLALNPLLVASVLGWTLSASGIGLAPIVDDVLTIAGRAALPLGFLAVGAALRPSRLRGHARAIAASSIVQFGLKPALGAGLALALSLDGVPRAALLIALMVPTAPSAYVLARQLGGDTDAMASIVTAQTLFACVTLPVTAGMLLV